MADDYQVQANGHGDYVKKPLLELYVKVSPPPLPNKKRVQASGIDSRRIGACLFCQEFWMELFALYEIGVARVEVGRP